MTKASDDPRWQNLTHKERVAYLDKHRDVNVDHEWWDSVYGMFIEDMEQIGIQVVARDITFSGFWSQGDGAAFKGRVDDWAKMFKHLGLLPSLFFYHDNLDYMRFNSIDPRNNCMRFDCCFEDPDNCPYDEDDDPIQYSLWYLTRPSGKELDDLESALAQMFNDAANKLYADLEAEYEYLTDDEQIIEYILEHEFDEENLLSCVD